MTNRNAMILRLEDDRPSGKWNCWKSLNLSICKKHLTILIYWWKGINPACYINICAHWSVRGGFVISKPAITEYANRTQKFLLCCYAVFFMSTVHVHTFFLRLTKIVEYDVIVTYLKLFFFLLATGGADRLSLARVSKTDNSLLLPPASLFLYNHQKIKSIGI